MSDILVSILIPSRKRFDKLLRVIDSIKATVNMETTEILIRFDMWDDEAINRCRELISHPNILYIWGNTARTDDKPDHSKFAMLWDENYQRASGKWVIPSNDDIFFLTKGWDESLAKISTDCIVWPDVHQLGESIYNNDLNGGVPILPKVLPRLEYPTDKKPVEALRAMGYKDAFIPLHILHNREVDETLPAGFY